MSDASILAAIEDAAYSIALDKIRLARLFKRAHRSRLGWPAAFEAYRRGQARAKEDVRA